MRHRALAAGLVLAALLMKFLVPGGFMPVASNGTITIALCGGQGPQMMAMPGMAGRHGERDSPAKSEMPCGFSGLSAPSLAAADPIILALAIVFIIATVFRVAAASNALRPVFLRPPATGPPAAA
jgi:hypothetical protein